MKESFDPRKIEALLRRAREVVIMVADFRDECDFGQWLRVERRSRDMPLRELAGLTGVSIGYLSDLERGQRKPTPALAEGVALAFGLELFEVEARILVGRMAADLEKVSGV
jgi:transcriptional regulator with XRE-family HTH domain